MLAEALQFYLSSDHGMMALLGTPQTRPDSTSGIFPVQAPDQPSMGYVVMSQVSGVPLQVSMDGTGNLTEERWRFSCAGTTYRNAKELAKYLRYLLLSFNGNQSVGSVWLQGAWCKLEADDTEPLGKGTLYNTHVDFSFVYSDVDVD